jgi:hypothetical protein
VSDFGFHRHKVIDILAEDPTVWGYLPLEGRSSYVPDPGSDSPLRVYLAGSGWLNIPTELSNIVTIHTGLNYSGLSLTLETF